MTTPRPEEDSVPTAASADTGLRERATLARKWAYLISMTAYLPMPHTEVEQHLRDLLERLFDAVTNEPVAVGEAAEVGARLVELHCVGRTSLQCTVDVLAGAFLADSGLRRLDRLAERVARLLGALASGYADAIRSTTVEQHDNLNRALLEAVWTSEQSRKAFQAQLEEVLACLDSGIAITDLDGRFVRANAAFHTLAGLAHARGDETTLFDLVHLEDRGALRKAYRDLLDAKPHRLRWQPRLLRPDGEAAEVSLVVSLLRGVDGRPSHYLTIIADQTEVALLRGQLRHQLLHDVLTGLPNRQFFTTRLERALQPGAPITVYQLDLDNFSVITDGLGRAVAEALLRTIAQRLTATMAAERGMVARFEGARFAVLVECSPVTPDPMTLAERFGEAVAKPIELLDVHTATSASIGVVHRPASGTDPEEILRNAGMALRRAKHKGPAQWALHDPGRDAGERRTLGLAATMSGAWRGGQLRVVYRPLVRLADHQLLGVEAMLRWNQPEYGSLPHDRCLELAEQTGLLAPLGRWLLRIAGEQVRTPPRRSGPEPLLAIDLTPDQSSDPELLATVLRVLDETGLPPGQLQLAMPVPELLADHGHAAENLRSLAAAGVHTAVHQFGTVPGHLTSLEDLPVDAVRIAHRTVGRATSLAARALADLIALVHLAGASVIVDDVATRRQAEWCEQAGADTATGPAFGTAGPLANLLGGHV